MKRKKAIIKDTIISLIPTLNSDEIEEVAQVVELSQFTFYLDKLQKQIREARYSEGVFICPTCHGTHIVKNGKKKGVQRYMCCSCKKSFSNQTATPTTR